MEKTPADKEVTYIANFEFNDKNEMIYRYILSMFYSIPRADSFKNVNYEAWTKSVNNIKRHSLQGQ